MELVIKNLCKTYSNGVKALDSLSLEISNGMFGLLGPNGAGKSSLMRTLATLQEADSGTIYLNDINILENPIELRKILGYLPQEFGVYPKITAKQLLDHLAILKGITNNKERIELVNFLLQKVNLYEKRNKSVKGFSGGMKQRIGIAQALIGNPKLIIVDEPTAGLDPGERNRFHNLLADVAEDVIIILSTHIVEDVRELCQNMAIMNQGKLICKGRPQHVIDELNDKVWQKLIGRNELEEYSNEHMIISNKMVGGKPLIHVLSDIKPGVGFTLVPPTLEDVFFSKINTTREVV
ncbi:ABC-type multidrug transport system ATPase subunit [Aquimarina sp. EL_43]|uniref:ABC transporter ATP-binding protein n=1 Tax=Aquimarina TaxID=290174 RepID=UPI000471A2B3|nr:MULTISPECIES: ABC transporter ATP-binding protein [Aquimarina]MBG6129603.1 ABC-type multidrug transport system ATPase subunit [Aquimarina sp. EL_35]MBG6150668.1 ABC-type multidrug transport system ATPase subunit [Aquimarina sp. EL_32]MBG6168025.1 ABC-type multidrug transport system ATPase subunit [Aquimarina sp. EL_43]